MHRHATVILLSLLVVFLGAYILWERNHHTMYSSPETQLSADTQSSGDQVKNEGFISVPTMFQLDPNNPDVTIFTSNNLGVRFSYINKAMVGQTGSKTNPPRTVNMDLPIQAGNTISLSGEPIVVFNKDPKVSFADALKAQFLTGYDAKLCYPVVTPITQGIEKGYESASINYPPNTNGDMGPNPGTCPAEYAQTNAVRYYLYNPAQPDRFLFLNPGQAVTALAPDKEHGFETTIEIIAKPAVY